MKLELKEMTSTRFLLVCGGSTTNFASFTFDDDDAFVVVLNIDKFLRFLAIFWGELFRGYDITFTHKYSPNSHDVALDNELTPSAPNGEIISAGDPFMRPTTFVSLNFKEGGRYDKKYVASLYGTLEHC